MFINTVRSALIAIAVGASTLSIAVDADAAPPVGTSGINPYLLLEASRAQLAAAYPTLDAHALDSLAFRIADINSMVPAAGDVRGSWSCLFDSKPAVLSLRRSSYALQRPGEGAMSGEYQIALDTITVDGGPLRGMGISQGVLDRTQSPRRIAFLAPFGTLACTEVL